MYKYAVFCLLIGAVLAVPAPESQAANLDCLKHEEMFSCFAVKAANAIDRAARSADLKLIEGVAFVRATPVERNARSLKTETELMSELPHESTDRTMQLVSMIFDNTVSFFKSHSLEVNMPEDLVARSLDAGRTLKKKKSLLPLILGVGLKMLALKKILAVGLIFLVVKALFVSKIAMLIAGTLAYQRLFSGAGGPVGALGALGGNAFGQNPQPGGWYNNNNNQGQGYYRSFSDNADSTAAQELAYSAHATNTNQAN